jgi:hypothetical protein
VGVAFTGRRRGVAATLAATQLNRSGLEVGSVFVEVKRRGQSGEITNHPGIIRRVQPLLRGVQIVTGVVANRVKAGQ